MEENGGEEEEGGGGGGGGGGNVIATAAPPLTQLLCPVGTARAGSTMPSVAVPFSAILTAGEQESLISDWTD